MPTRDADIGNRRLTVTFRASFIACIGVTASMPSDDRIHAWRSDSAAQCQCHLVRVRPPAHICPLGQTVSACNLSRSDARLSPRREYHESFQLSLDQRSGGQRLAFRDLVPPPSST
jgi:hypothetical protein